MSLGRDRVKHQGDVAPPALIAGIHRPEQAGEHHDDPRQVVGNHVGAHLAGLLGATRKATQGVVQIGGDVGCQRTGLARYREHVVFARAQRHGRLDQVSEAAQRVVGVEYPLDDR